MPDVSTRFSKTSGWALSGDTAARHGRIWSNVFLAQDLHLPGHPRCVVKLVTLLDYMVQYDFRSRYATAAEALAALQETFPPSAPQPGS